MASLPDKWTAESIVTDIPLLEAITETVYVPPKRIEKDTILIDIDSNKLISEFVDVTLDEEGALIEKATWRQKSKISRINAVRELFETEDALPMEFRPVSDSHRRDKLSIKSSIAVIYVKCGLVNDNLCSTQFGFACK